MWLAGEADGPRLAKCMAGDRRQVYPNRPTPQCETLLWKIRRDSAELTPRQRRCGARPAAARAAYRSHADRFRNAGNDRRRRRPQRAFDQARAAEHCSSPVTPIMVRCRASARATSSVRATSSASHSIPTNWRITWVPRWPKRAPGALHQGDSPAARCLSRSPLDPSSPMA
jgi:hypothetical protein